MPQYRTTRAIPAGTILQVNPGSQYAQEVPARWRPASGAVYYFVTSSGKVDSSHESTREQDVYRIAVGNCYENAATATKYAERAKLIGEVVSFMDAHPVDLEDDSLAFVAMGTTGVVFPSVLDTDTDLPLGAIIFATEDVAAEFVERFGSRLQMLDLQWYPGKYNA